MNTLWKVTSAVLDAASHFVELQLRGPGAEGDDASAEPADAAVFLQQLGITVAPVVRDTLRALGERYGKQILALKLWDKSAQPTGLSAGQTVVWCVGDNTVRITLSPAGIEIVAGATASQRVAHGGSSTVSHVHPAGGYTAGPYAVAGVSGGTAAALDPATCATKVHVTP